MDTNETGFLLIPRMQDQFLAEWKEGINSNRKLCDYVNFKVQFGYEMYLDILKVRQFRSIFARFRLSCHDLEANRGRYNNIERENRKCRYCRNKVEEEYHFLLTRLYYLDIRKQYIPEKFFLEPNLHKFNIYMSTIFIFILCF